MSIINFIPKKNIPKDIQLLEQINSLSVSALKKYESSKDFIEDFFSSFLNNKSLYIEENLLQSLVYKYSGFYVNPRNNYISRILKIDKSVDLQTIYFIKSYKDLVDKKIIKKHKANDEYYILLQTSSLFQLHDLMPLMLFYLLDKEHFFEKINDYLNTSTPIDSSVKDFNNSSNSLEVKLKSMFFQDLLNFYKFSLNLYKFQLNEVEHSYLKDEDIKNLNFQLGEIVNRAFKNQGFIINDPTKGDIKAYLDIFNKGDYLSQLLSSNKNKVMNAIESVCTKLEVHTVNILSNETKKNKLVTALSIASIISYAPFLLLGFALKDRYDNKKLNEIKEKLKIKTLYVSDLIDIFDTLPQELQKTIVEQIDPTISVLKKENQVFEFKNNSINILQEKQELSSTVKDNHLNKKRFNKI